MPTPRRGPPAPAVHADPAALHELRYGLRTLRRSWHGRWPGLRRVLHGCLRRLGHPGFEDSRRGHDLCAAFASTPRHQRLLAAAFEVGQACEVHNAALAARHREPAYHNRLHFSDTLVSMTLMLAQARQADPAVAVAGMPDLEQEALMLLVMTAHDYLHDGSLNHTPHELELRSVAGVAPLLEQAGVDDADHELIKRLVVGTDSVRIAGNHAGVAGLPFSLHDERWLQVLANEADICASTMPDLGPELGFALAREVAGHAPQLASILDTAAGRHAFLKNTALFSSPPSHALGLLALSEQQILELTAPEGSTP